MLHRWDRLPFHSGTHFAHKHNEEFRQNPELKDTEEFQGIADWLSPTIEFLSLTAGVAQGLLSKRNTKE